MLEQRPRIVVTALGGTIAMTTGGAPGVVPKLTAAELTAAVPGLDDVAATIEFEDFRQLPGASLTFQDLRELAASIRDRLIAGAIGVVVTQGTDTIEESAYLLDLLHDLPNPVVVTGAMRNPTLAGADGPANILAAIRVAASPDSRHQGVLVVLADEIHAARRVRKSHSTGCATFRSPDGGPLGYLVEGTPRLLNRLAHRTVLPPEITRPGCRVALHTITLDDDGALLDQLGRSCDGLVVAGFGVGHVPAGAATILADLATRIPVLLASRTGSGSVLRNTYGFPGSEQHLIQAGLLPTGFLDPLKARILLHCLLCVGADRDEITAAVAVAGGYSDPAGWPWQPVTSSSHPADATSREATR